MGFSFNYAAEFHVFFSCSSKVAYCSKPSALNSGNGLFKFQLGQTNMTEVLHGLPQSLHTNSKVVA